MTGAADLPSLIERFFTQRLMQQRNASPHTVASYRDTFRLLFTFAQKKLGKPPSRLDLADLDAPFIGAFLDDLEASRSIGIKTRNLRLTAIRAFFRFVAFEEPAHAGQIQRVLAIPGKLHDKREVHFLTRSEIDAILAAPDRDSWMGRRDHVLLHFAAQTGLRLSEIIQLEHNAVVFGTGAHVRCIGKGRKERATPLTRQTCHLLQAWLKEAGQRGSTKLFPNIHGGDLSADAASQQIANIDGTRHAMELAEAIGAGCFHHTSSIAAAGLYHGVFREDMFDEAEGLDNAYFRTKHDSEGLVRKECKVPWRIYRPGVVVGHSQTGEMDKIDGPYYFFTLIKKMRELLPPWMPTMGIEGGRINLVPVDFVAAAMDHIAHKRGLDGQCFHLVDPDPPRIGEVLNIFCRAAGAPEMTMRLDARMFAFVPAPVRMAVTGLPPVKRFIGMMLRDLKIPREVLGLITYPTRFDARETERALKGSKIAVPPLESYGWRLWDYWYRNLDPDLFVDRSLRGKIRGKVVLITGGSSGIGRATAEKVAAAGAKTIIVARGEEELFKTRDELIAA
ncbi:MAG: hypothetical protein CVU23_08690, partial [Betaproteobacteria bacterium HGW-Betaproteobacteria-17]